MRFLISTMAACLVFGLTTAMAGISAPRSHATLSADGKRLLVMISPAREFDEHNPVVFLVPDGRSIILHKTFLKSGCYDATAFTPIWQSDFFALKWNLLWSDDFTDVVHPNQFGLGGDRFGLEGAPSGPDSDWALKFYHEGRLTKRYRCRELLTGLDQSMFFPSSTWDYYLKWWEVFRLDNGYLELRTMRRRVNLLGYELNFALHENYLFKLSTGEIVSRSSVGAALVWGYAGSFALITGGALFALWYSLKSGPALSVSSDVTASR